MQMLDPTPSIKSRGVFTRRCMIVLVMSFMCVSLGTLAISIDHESPKMDSTMLTPFEIIQDACNSQVWNDVADLLYLHKQKFASLKLDNLHLDQMSVSHCTFSPTLRSRNEVIQDFSRSAVNRETEGAEDKNAFLENSDPVQVKCEQDQNPADYKLADNKWNAEEHSFLDVTLHNVEFKINSDFSYQLEEGSMLSDFSDTGSLSVGIRGSDIVIRIYPSPNMQNEEDDIKKEISDSDDDKFFVGEANNLHHTQDTNGYIIDVMMTIPKISFSAQSSWSWLYESLFSVEKSIVAELVAERVTSVMKKALVRWMTAFTLINQQLLANDDQNENDFQVMVELPSDCHNTDEDITTQHDGDQPRNDDEMNAIPCFANDDQDAETSPRIDTGNPFEKQELTHDDNQPQTKQNGQYALAGAIPEDASDSGAEIMVEEIDINDKL